jgi:hypothetical protein
VDQEEQEEEILHLEEQARNQLNLEILEHLDLVILEDLIQVVLVEHLLEEVVREQQEQRLCLE